MSADVIPFGVFLEAREKKLDPKGYASRKVYEAISEQVKAKEAADKPLLIGDVPEMDEGFDDIPVMDRGDQRFLWGTEADQYMRQRLLNRYFAEQQSDPGDEI